jgi:sec-independent protein translocase protein TatA
MFGLDIRELLILVGILILFFGPKKIPEITRGIGKSIRYFKSGFSNEDKGDETDKIA